MLLRIFILIVVLIALVVGIMALVLPRDAIVRLIVFRDFFDVSLPVLAFGALIKYLCTCCYRKGVCGVGKNGCGCNCNCCSPKA